MGYIFVCIELQLFGLIVYYAIKLEIMQYCYSFIQTKKKAFHWHFLYVCFLHFSRIASLPFSHYSSFFSQCFLNLHSFLPFPLIFVIVPLNLLCFISIYLYPKNEFVPNACHSSFRISSLYSLSVNAFRVVYKQCQLFQYFVKILHADGRNTKLSLTHTAQL